MNLTEKELRCLLESIWIKSKGYDKPESISDTDYRKLTINKEISELKEKKMFAIYGDVNQSKVIINGEDLHKEEQNPDTEKEEEDAENNKSIVR